MQWPPRRMLGPALRTAASIMLSLSSGRFRGHHFAALAAWEWVAFINACNQLVIRDEYIKMQFKEEHLRGLLIGGLAGDEAAYRLFLDHLCIHLRSFVRSRLVQRPEDVEDLVQELLLAIHNQRHTYDCDQPLTAWVNAIARYKFIDYLRRRSRKESLHDPLDQNSDILVSTDISALEARYDMAKLLRKLPDRQRIPILYVKIQGASVADAAKRTGMSESAIKVAIHRGLKALAAAVGGLA